MSFCLVFFMQTRTTAVVPISSVTGGTQVGDVSKVRWEGRNYKAKVLYKGHKELCEVKAPLVTVEGELQEDLFEMSSFNVSAASPHEDDSEQRPRWERESMTRLIEIAESVSSLKENVVHMSSMVMSVTQKQDRIEQMVKELLRRNPARNAEAVIDYNYVSAKTVAELRQLKGPNHNAFAIALEDLVYRDDPHELELSVDHRVRSTDRILFIQQCLFKYYSVPEHLQADLWKKVKQALNSKVRRRRKATRDAGREQQTSYHEDDCFGAYDILD